MQAQPATRADAAACSATNRAGAHPHSTEAAPRLHARTGLHHRGALLVRLDRGRQLLRLRAPRVVRKRSGSQKQGMIADMRRRAGTPHRHGRIARRSAGVHIAQLGARRVARAIRCRRRRGGRRFGTNLPAKSVEARPSRSHALLAAAPGAARPGRQACCSRSSRAAVASWCRAAWMCRWAAAPSAALCAETRRCRPRSAVPELARAATVVSSGRAAAWMT